MSNFEKTGLIPRSIIRIFKRFLKQISLKTDLFVIYEFRLSRYITIVSFQCFLLLIFCPFIFQIFVKFFIMNMIPFEKTMTNIFVNYSQQEHAFYKIQKFSQKIYFETLFKSFNDKKFGFKNKKVENNFTFSKDFAVQKLYQEYFIKCAQFYNKQTILIIINWILDFITIIFFIYLLFFLTPQILILKTFFIESIIGLNEIMKCFFIIFFLDLLVGFHSSKSWEIFLQLVVEHFGFQIYENKNFIAFFVSTFPVLLDTIFKYWIFRYLNKISPSTVATYQAMLE
uniref:Envelope membrane protein n=1 Tax=Boodleopsis sp. H.0758 TaxID=2320802 RepID=A0A386AZQ6_9CHLO|nr:Envelope membrane protein [Boodleopsis sp. H.0758]AYC64919.1 Envelope membrane protein [Boodleopsis sp. H.0758]